MPVILRAFMSSYHSDQAANYANDEMQFSKMTLDLLGAVAGLIEEHEMGPAEKFALGLVGNWAVNH